MIRRIIVHHYESEPTVAQINEFLAKKLLKPLAGSRINLSEWTLRISKPGEGLNAPGFEDYWSLQVFKDEV